MKTIGLTCGGGVSNHRYIDRYLGVSDQWMNYPLIQHYTSFCQFWGVYVNDYSS